MNDKKSQPNDGTDIQVSNGDRKVFIYLFTSIIYLNYLSNLNCH